MWTAIIFPQQISYFLWHKKNNKGLCKCGMYPETTNILRESELIDVVIVQSLSLVPLFRTLWTAAHQAPLSSTISRSLLKLKSIESVIPSYHLIPSHPFFLLPSIFPSIRVFSSESVLHIRWPKYWSFNFSNSPSSECSRLTGLISLQSEGLKEFSPVPQFESISFQALSLLYGAKLLMHLSIYLKDIVEMQHTYYIQRASFKWTMQWFSVYSQIHAVITVVHLRTFISSQKETPYPLAISVFPSSSSRP